AGISRKRRDVYIFARHNVDGVLNAGFNVLRAEGRIVIPDDGLRWNAIANQFQHSMNRNSGAGDARLPEVNFGAHLDSIHGVNIDPEVWQFNTHTTTGGQKDLKQ